MGEWWAMLIIVDMQLSFYHKVLKKIYFSWNLLILHVKICVSARMYILYISLYMFCMNLLNCYHFFSQQLFDGVLPNLFTRIWAVDISASACINQHYIIIFQLQIHKDNITWKYLLWSSKFEVLSRFCL